MLIAAITAIAMLFGFGSTSDSRAMIQQLTRQVERTVADEDRRGDALDALNQAIAELDAFDARLVMFESRFKALDENYYATPNQFQNLFNDLDAEWKATELRLVDLRFEMRDALSEEEWNTIFQAVTPSEMASY